jgi:hypothetical protein
MFFFKKIILEILNNINTNTEYWYKWKGLRPLKQVVMSSIFVLFYAWRENSVGREKDTLFASKLSPHRD